MHRRTFLGSCILGAGAAYASTKLAAAAEAAAPLQVGSRRELFVDDFLIDRLSGADLRLQHPVPQEVALACDAPWEGTGSGYHSVFQDGDRYRLYYRGSQLGVAAGKLSEPKGVACYAESDDGITWHRPELGLFEFNGSKKNNIVLHSGKIDGLSRSIDAGHLAIFLDENPDAAPEARYKGFLASFGKPSGLYAFGSADGLRWRPLDSNLVLTDGAFDSQNLAFWDAAGGQYRAYFRFFNQGRRDIKAATSSDFIHWSPARPLAYPGAQPEQLYTNQVKPYYRAPHILIGFPTRYVERGWSDSMRALPELELREQRAKANLRYGTALTEGLLMSSRDGQTFHRWAEALLRPGPQRAGTWNYGNQYIAWHVVETRSTLDPALRELSLYATERYWHGPGSVLRRYTLRLDGFVALHGPMKGGECVTKPLVFDGRRLAINFATSAAGAVRVELQDPAGKALDGFALADSQEVFGDELDRVVTWKSGSDVSSLAGKPVRLRLVLNDADVFAVQFQA